jgi:hypothetical protein
MIYLLASTNTPSKVLVPHIKTVLKFFDKILEFSWLDGHRFPTNKVVVQLLAQRYHLLGNPLLMTRFLLHMTPRQMSRHWILLQNDEFLHLLQKHRIPCFRRMYLKDHSPTSLNTHFKILDVFQDPDAYKNSMGN